MGKGEIARNEQFLLFPQCFLPSQIIVSPFIHIFDIISLLAAELVEPNIAILAIGFLTNQIIVSPFIHIFDITSLFAAELVEPIIAILDIG